MDEEMPSELLEDIDAESHDYQQGEEDITDLADGGILKSVICVGEGKQTPVDGSLITAYIKGSYQGKTFEEREVTFHLGLGFEQRVVEGIEVAIKKFKKGEKSRLTISHEYAFSEQGNKELSVPAHATVQYEVQVLSFSKPKELWELSTAEKLNLAERYKAKGTSLFQSGVIAESLTAYEKAKEAIMEDPNYSKEERAKRKTLLLQLHLNTALCQLKMCLWNDALASCRSALDIESQNEKALYRKAQAYMGREDYEEAIDTYRAVLNLNSTNRAAISSLSTAKQKLKTCNERVKQTYAGMFQKFADKDNQEEALAKARGNVYNEPIGYWSNDMAAGMMSLQQEMEAFGERMPERSRRSSGGSGGNSPRQ